MRVCRKSKAMVDNNLKTIVLVSLVIGFAVTATSCVSTHMKQFIGQDIREVIMVNGQPIDAFDLADGKRAFQYRFGGGQLVQPSVSTESGTAIRFKNQAWFEKQTITKPSRVVELEGCLISYIAWFDEQKNSWIIEDIRYPKQLVC